MTSSTDGAIGNGTSATWLRVDCGGYKDGSVDDIAGNDSVSNDDGMSTTQHDSFMFQYDDGVAWRPKCGAVVLLQWQWCGASGVAPCRC